MSATAAGSAPAERLLNLVVALLNENPPLTRRDIRRKVAGYDIPSTDAAFERMFERDKETLRNLGVPVETIEMGGAGEDTAYRIDRQAYRLPPVNLTGAELGAVRLATQLFGDRQLQADTAHALTKLLSATTPLPDFDLHADPLPGLAPRLRAAGSAYQPLLNAISERREVHFQYRTARTGILSRRRLYPWRIAARGAGWYVIGHDIDRAAVRVFRFSRIEGPVRAVGEPQAFTIPDDDVLEATIGEPPATQTATLLVTKHRAAVLRARATATASSNDPERDLITVPFVDLAFADEIAAFGAAVVVQNPPALRDAVIARLEAAVRLGDGGGDGGGDGQDEVRT